MEKLGVVLLPPTLLFRTIYVLFRSHVEKAALSFLSGHGIPLYRVIGADGSMTINRMPCQPKEAILPPPLSVAGWLLW